MATKQIDLKPKCKYGAKCYRRNADHLKGYSHPKRTADKSDEEGDTMDMHQTKKARIEVEQSSTEAGDDQAKTKVGMSEDKLHIEEKTIDDEEDCSGSDEGGDDEDGEEEVSTSDVKAFIKHKFLVDMPSDFYEFWEFCKKENPSNPADVFQHSLGFQLVGPYDILAGNHLGDCCNKRGKKANFLRHWRYYYDPPEFLTVLRGDDAEQFHIGYYRDDPSEMPVFLAANAAKSSCILQPRGDNIFSTVGFYIKDKLKLKDISGDMKKSLTSMGERLTERATELDLSMEVKSKAMKARQKTVVCDTFHMAGIVVPVDENEVGYREVPESPGDLKKILAKIRISITEKERNVNFDPLQELITLIQFANDEGDYGEGLELGLDLFSFGGRVFHSTILHLLSLAYQFLHRPQYGRIIAAHLKRRSHSAELNELE